jgi:uncharacterized Zn finger protein
VLCKHVCAVLYGIGARFDRAPALLFELRGTDPTELIASAATSELGKTSSPALEGDLGALFGIELDEDCAPRAVEPPTKAAPISKERSRKNKVATAPRAAASRKTKPVPEKHKGARATRTRTALIALGVRPSTIAFWLRTNVLRRTAKRGVYAVTKEALARIAAYTK